MINAQSTQKKKEKKSFSNLLHVKLKKKKKYFTKKCKQEKL